MSGRRWRRRAAARLARILGLGACATVTAVTGRALAQSNLVVVVSAEDAAAGDPGAAGRPVANALGASALWDTAAARAIDRRYAAPRASGDPLAPVRERLRSAREAWATASGAGDASGEAQAIEALNAAAREAERGGDALDQPENQRAIRRALLFLAERYLADGARAQAEDAMRRLAQIDPSIDVTAREASPDVQQLYARAVAATPRGGLSVQSVPAGCAVFRDGREVGMAPAELRDLTPGEHRVTIRCGAELSRVHTVTVAANTTATLVVDSVLDSALATASVPLLRYPAMAQARPRLAQDLGVLGRATGARRVYGVLGSTGRVVVVDANASAEVGEAASANASGLRALMNQLVPQSGVLSQRVEAVSTTAATTAATTTADTRTTAASGVTVDTEVPAATQQNGGGGALATAVVLGAVGVVAVGGGVYADLVAQGLENHAQQNGADLHGANETNVTGTNFGHQAQFARDFEIGLFVGGGALVLTGVLVGVLGRGHGERRAVEAFVLPSAGGGVAGVGGVF